MTGPLEVIQATLPNALTPTSWAADNYLRGLRVAKARRYQAGDHDAQMTEEMKKALRVTETDSKTPFNSNQMDDVITTMTDRLTVDRIEGDNDATTAWAADVLEWNRFDGLQMDVHEATLRDANSYLAVDFDNEEQMPYFCHEQAWDGRSGMMVVHEASDKNQIAMAVKVWLETTVEYADTLRYTVYYDNRIERWIRVGEGQAEHYVDKEYPDWPIWWTMDGTATGEALGVPVVQFRNRSQGKGGYGQSELQNAIPLQDALNRTLHSMVMTGEFSAFAVFVALGFKAPAAITPGMVINVGESGLTKDQVADMKRIPGEMLTPYIDMANFFIQRIEAVTRTPNMSANSNLSGEAMKQSEIKLIGKVKRFQVTAGNSWEDVMALAVRVQAAFGTNTPPASKRWRTKWKDAQIRNDKDTVANAMLIKDVVGQKQTVENLATVYEWDEAKQQQILADTKQGQADRLAALTTNFNQFGGGNRIAPQQMQQANPMNGNMQNVMQNQGVGNG